MPGHPGRPRDRPHQRGLAAERDQAKDDAASARTLAIIGLIVGALGLVAGVAALATRRRSPAQATPTRDSETTTAPSR